MTALAHLFRCLVHHTPDPTKTTRAIVKTAGGLHLWSFETCRDCGMPWVMSYSHTMMFQGARLDARQHPAEGSRRSPVSERPAACSMGERGDSSAVLPPGRGEED